MMLKKHSFKLYELILSLFLFLGSLVVLQELVDHSGHLFLHPLVPLLLGRRPRSQVDLLLHRHPHRLQRGSHRPFHSLGQSH